MTTNPLDWLDDELADWTARGLRRHLVVRDGPQCPESVRIEHESLVNFGSNDYLGLAAEELTAAVRTTLDEAGWGSGASPLVSGRGKQHALLEQELAAFEGLPAALLFPSGFAANLSTIAALVGRGDAIFSDRQNHASIIDGCRVSGARILVYPHGDAAALDRLLTNRQDFRRRLIVTDSLFSMDGDVAPLEQLAELAEQHGAMLMVDEAHATGVFGERGRGVCESLGVEDGVHVRVGTLSKAFGSIGGFVVGSQSLIDWLSNRARAYVFSTAAPAATAAAGREALRIVQAEPQRRRQLLEVSAELRQQLQQQGWNTGNSTSQIIPVILGDPEQTMQYAAQLRRQGLFVPGIRPPSVPKGQSLLRISLSYAHTRQQIEQLLDAMRHLDPIGD